MMRPMGIPDDFWWGTAASSTQTEGAAPASDWLAWERAGRAPASGDGNGFGLRHHEDLEALAELGLPHHRLSLEWARLETSPGRHDPAAVEHYRSMLQHARDVGLTTWVCLHHFTLPGWFSKDEGGFVDDRARGYFWPRHLEWVAETFGDLVDGWKPINEPVAYAGGGWLLGEMPPGTSDLQQFLDALRGTLLAKQAAWEVLRQTGSPVCTIHNLSPLFADRSGTSDEQAASSSLRAMVDQVLWTSWIRLVRDGVLSLPGRPDEEVPGAAGSFDLIGFSYYFASTISASGAMGPYPPDGRIGPMGQVPWSAGLRLVLERLADELPGRPLVVAEHGVGTEQVADGEIEDDAWRCEVLDESLQHVASAIDDGIDVRGFFHWTAVDNYEWTYGDSIRFGCIDRQRRPKPSAALLSAWARGERR